MSKKNWLQSFKALTFGRCRPIRTRGTAHNRQRLSLERFEDRLTPAVITGFDASELYGNMVSISGSGFQSPGPATAVLFNGTAATYFVVNSDTDIEVQVPLGFTAVQLNGLITVLAPSGDAESEGAFTLDISPTLDHSFTTWTTGGLQYVIDGWNLGSTTSVMIAGDAVSFTVASDFRLLISIDSVPLGNESLLITTPNGVIESSLDNEIGLINGIAPGQVGQFDVGDFDDDTASQETYGTYVGTTGRVYLLDGESYSTWLSSLEYYVDRGPNLEVSNLEDISTILTSPTLVGPNTIQSTGFFTGSNGNQINWTATGTIPAGAQKYVTTFAFSVSDPATETLGIITVRTRLDEDVFDLTDDFFATSGSAAADNFLALTIDGPDRIGYALGGSYSANGGLINATYDGFAASNFYDLDDTIQARTQSYSLTPNAGAGFETFNIDTDKLPAHADPFFGNIYGGEEADNSDVGGSLSWTVISSATTASFSTFLGNISSDPASAPSIDSTTAPASSVGQPYSFGPAVSGGVPGYTFSIAEGALPLGLALDAATGVISGTPTIAGAYAFTLAVSDSEGGSDSQLFTLTVNAAALAVPVSGVVFLDYNADGVRNGPDAGLSGRRVFVDADNNGTFSVGEVSTFTDGNGAYRFDGVSPGANAIRVDLFPSEVSVVGPNGGTVSVTAGQPVTGADLGLRKLNPAFPVATSTDLFGASNPDQQTAVVHGLYVGILGREGSAEEIQGWVSSLRAGLSLADVGRAFLSSDEYLDNQVDDAYRIFLGRAADAEGRDGWVEQLRQGMTYEEMAALFLTSGEYQSRYPDAEGFVRSLFRNELGREGDEGEVQGYVARLTAGETRDALARGFITSTEAYLRAIDSLYAQLLNRPGEDAGRANWLGFVQGGGRLTDLAVEFILLPEFGQRASVSVG